MSVKVLEGWTKLSFLDASKISKEKHLQNYPRIGMKYLFHLRGEVAHWVVWWLNEWYGAWLNGVCGGSMRGEVAHWVV